MKTVFFLTIFFQCFLLITRGQDLLKDAAAFDRELGKVVADYPQSFKNLRGDIVMEDAEEIKYASTVELPGVNDCLVSASLNGKQKVKWEAIVFSSADFNKAASLYKDIHDQLLKTNFILSGKSKSKLAGKYSHPQLSSPYTSTLYRLIPVVKNFRDCSVELELVNILEEWKVNIRVGVAGIEE